MQGEEIGAMRRTKKNSQTKDTTRKKYIFYIGIFFCISLIYVYVNSYFLVSGADFDFHTSRIIGLANSLENNHWFPKINYYMANGLGYGTPMFYGEWFLYIPAILISFFNFSVVQSWMALYVCFYTGSLTILFFTAKKFELSDFRAFSFCIDYFQLFNGNYSEWGNSFCYMLSTIAFVIVLSISIILF